MKLSIASLIAETLKRLGVGLIFGIIGTSVVDFFDTLYDKPELKVVTVRHEQVAVSAADAVYRTSRRLAASVVHAGPGFLNGLISLGISSKDRIPLIMVSGGVRRRLRGSDAWLEVNQKSISDGLVKGYTLIDRPDEAPETLYNTLKSILEPPLGPIVIEVSEDLWKSEVNVDKSYFSNIANHPKEGEVERDGVKDAIDLLKTSERPLILASGELAYSPLFKQEELMALAEKVDAYVVTSGNGRGACAEDNPRCLGRVGFGGGTPPADKALARCDALVVFGNEFDDTSTYAYTNMPEGDIMVFSMDPSVEKRPAYYDTIKGDPVKVLKEMNTELESKTASKDKWDSLIASWRNEWDLALKSSIEKRGKMVNPSMFFYKLNKTLDRERIITAGQGTHIIYAYDFLKVYAPGTFLASTNLGAMGYALPSALGASQARPDKNIISVTGDGEIMMVIQDLETIRRVNANVKVIVVNDNSYRVLYLRQVLQKGGRVFQTLLRNPDFKMLGESMGIKTMSLSSNSEVDKALELIKERGSALIELIIDRDEIPPLNMEFTLKMSSV